MKNKLVCILFSAVVFPVTASATSLTAGLIERAGFALGDVEGRSYDGPGHNPFPALLPYTDGKFYQLPSFSSGASGVSLDWLLGPEVAGSASSNELAVFSGGGSQTFIHGSNAAGDSGSLALAANETFGFRLDGPEGSLFSQDSLNPLGAAQFVVLRMNQAGSASVLGHIMNWEADDIFLMIEDLPLPRSDQDWNDMVVRMHEVPEPSTILLLSAGLFGAGMRRRSRALS